LFILHLAHLIIWHWRWNFYLYFKLPTSNFRYCQSTIVLCCQARVVGNFKNWYWFVVSQCNKVRKEIILQLP